MPAILLQTYLNWRLSNSWVSATNTKPSVRATVWLWCVWQSVTVCVSVFEQELWPPFPFQSYTQQWTHRCTGLLINSPVESLDLWGCYISSGSWKYMRTYWAISKDAAMHCVHPLKVCARSLYSLKLDEHVMPQYCCCFEYEMENKLWGCYD